MFYHQDIIDERLARFLAIKLRDSKVDYTLRTLANCGRKSSYHVGVTILSNGQEAKIFGPQYCSNSWCCPRCTARQTRNFARRIDAAIQALSKQNLVPFMITFTMFHMQNINCETSINVLRHAYTDMIKAANWKRKKANKEGYYTKGGTWNNFIHEFNIRHIIKSMEITVGEHGWHPHYHILFFVEKSRLQQVKSWEKELQDHWNKKLDKFFLKFIPPEVFPNFYSLKAKYFKDPKNAHKGLYISKEKDNSVKQMKTGDYIAGWGAADELTNTNNLKQANENHYTPLALLEKYYNTQNEKYWNLFVEFALVQHKYRLHKIDFSRTGLNAIVKNWIQTQEFKETIAKKNTFIAQKIKPFHTVCWFTSSLWQDIYWINIKTDIPLIELILCFAKYDNGYDLICELCEVLDLEKPLAKNPRFDPAEAFNSILEQAA